MYNGIVYIKNKKQGYYGSKKWQKSNFKIKDIKEQ